MRLKPLVFPGPAILSDVVGKIGQDERPTPNMEEGDLIGRVPTNRHVFDLTRHEGAVIAQGAGKGHVGTFLRQAGGR